VKKAAQPTKTMKKPAAPKKYERRADLGAPIDGFFAKQQPHLRPILEELRKLVEEAAPDATSAIKWGMPFYTVGGQMMCALAGFKGARQPDPLRAARHLRRSRWPPRGRRQDRTPPEAPLARRASTGGRARLAARRGEPGPPAGEVDPRRILLPPSVVVLCEWEGRRT
jgi:hypothetical protein